jgi:GNAT superfamily N-acetyltransferase
MSGLPRPEFEIENLRREHDVTQFDCGNATLNTWLHRYAWTNQQADSAKTYVALVDERVVGYYALTTGSVHKHETPERIARGLANHPIGIVLLARLAVDTTQQSRGLGKALLFDEGARRFYEHFEFERSPVDPFQLLLLLKDLRKALQSGK